MKLSIKVFLLLGVYIFTSTVFGQSTQTLILQTGEDTQICNQTKIHSNYANINQIQSTSSDNGSIFRMLIKFDLSGLPSDAVIQSAMLSLYSANYTAHNNGLNTNDNTSLVSRIVDPWVVTAVTWASQPGTTTVNQAVIPAVLNFENSENIDVTEIYKDILSSGSNNGVMISQLDELSPFSKQCYASFDWPSNSTLHPKLVIEYTTAEAPASDEPFEFSTTTEDAVFTNNKVGIGTADPQSELEVAGSIKTNGGNITISNSSANGSFKPVLAITADNPSSNEPATLQLTGAGSSVNWLIQGLSSNNSESLDIATWNPTTSTYDDLFDITKTGKVNIFSSTNANKYFYLDPDLGRFYSKSTMTLMAGNKKIVFGTNGDFYQVGHGFFYDYSHKRFGLGLQPQKAFHVSRSTSADNVLALFDNLDAGASSTAMIQLRAGANGSQSAGYMGMRGPNYADHTYLANRQFLWSGGTTDGLDLVTANQEGEIRFIINNGGPGFDYTDTRMIINSAGDVGIGTGETGPNAKLDVNGDVKVAGNLDAQSITVNGEPLNLSVDNTNNYVVFEEGVQVKDELKIGTNSLHINSEEVGVGSNNKIEAKNGPLTISAEGTDDITLDAFQGKINVSSPIVSSSSLDVAQLTINGQSIVASGSDQFHTSSTTLTPNLVREVGQTGAGKYPDENYYLIGNGTDGNQQASEYKLLVDFDFSSIPSNAKITSAKLVFTEFTTSLGETTLMGVEDDCNNPGLNAYSITSSWAGQQVTWATLPSTDVANGLMSLQGGSGSTYEIEIGSLIQSNIKHDQHGIMLSASCFGDRAIFAQGGTTLEIEYEINQGFWEAGIHDNQISSMENVGVNTHDPQANLHIAGNSIIDDNLTIGNAPTQYSGEYKLSVQGAIVTEKIISKASYWADYVFEEDYELRTPAQVRAYIAKNGHLPDVPSAAEVEESGIDLAAMNATLLRKVEELTLYMLKQEETNQSLKNRIEQLETK